MWAFSRNTKKEAIKLMRFRGRTNRNNSILFWEEMWQSAVKFAWSRWHLLGLWEMVGDEDKHMREPHNGFCLYILWRGNYPLPYIFYGAAISNAPTWTCRWKCLALQSTLTMRYFPGYLGGQRWVMNSFWIVFIIQKWWMKMGVVQRNTQPYLLTEIIIIKKSTTNVQLEWCPGVVS